MAAIPPLWREGRIGIEAALLARDPIARGEGVPYGDDQPVMVLPGFLAGDDSLSWMVRWMRANGYHARRSGINRNVDCSEQTAQRVEARLEELVKLRGRRFIVIGQSRGGTIARVLAVRRPDLVSGVIALGSPLKHQLAVHPLVYGSVVAVGALGTVGIPGLFRNGCWTSKCCNRFWQDKAAEFPAGVGFVSIYSRSDGIVDWASCLDPAARQVEVRSSHIGMGVNRHVWRAVAPALGEFSDRPAGRRRAKPVAPLAEAA